MSLYADLVQNTPQALSHWEARRSDAERDLLIKRIAVVVIALLNTAALGLALYYLIAYEPISVNVLISSPFIFGALSVLVWLKFPTCGLKESNYTKQLNPAILMGKVIAYILFCPLMLAINHIDWTPYYDEYTADKISTDFSKENAETVTQLYGKNIDQLRWYGFFENRDQGLLVKEFMEKYRAQQKLKQFWQEEGHETRADQVQQEIDSLDLEWKTLRERISLPHPPITSPDFTQESTKNWYKVRRFFYPGGGVSKKKGTLDSLRSVQLIPGHKSKSSSDTKKA